MYTDEMVLKELERVDKILHAVLMNADKSLRFSGNCMDYIELSRNFLCKAKNKLDYITWVKKDKKN